MICCGKEMETRIAVDREDNAYQVYHCTVCDAQEDKALMDISRQPKIREHHKKRVCYLHTLIN